MFAIVICTLLLFLSFPKEIPLYFCFCHFRRKSKCMVVIFSITTDLVQYKSLFSYKTLKIDNYASFSSNCSTSGYISKYFLKPLLLRINLIFLPKLPAVTSVIEPKSKMPKSTVFIFSTLL